MSVYCLVTSWLLMRLHLQLADLAQVAAQVEDELVEKLGRHTHDDIALQFAALELAALGIGNVGALDLDDQAGDVDDGDVVGIDLEIHLAGADDLAVHLDGLRSAGLDFRRLGLVRLG